MFGFEFSGKLDDISKKKKVTDIPDDLNASRTFLYLSQLLYDSEAAMLHCVRVLPYTCYLFEI